MLALNKVFNSYEKIGENSEVLIQKYVSNVKLSGVLFCCDLNTGSPYFSINYDLSILQIQLRVEKVRI